MCIGAKYDSSSADRALHVGCLLRTSSAITGVIKCVGEHSDEVLPWLLFLGCAHRWENGVSAAAVHRHCLRPGLVPESVLWVVLLNLEVQELASCPVLGGVCSVNVY